MNQFKAQSLSSQGRPLLCGVGVYNQHIVALHFQSWPLKSEGDARGFDIVGRREFKQIESKLIDVPGLTIDGNT